MAQLITAQQVIDRAFTNKNTDVDLIGDSFIEIAQEEHIRPVLAGNLDAADSLYQLIVDENNTASLSAENQILLDDYIVPCLAFYVKFELLTDMHINTSSQGLQVLNTEFSNAASNEQRANLTAKAKSHGDTLRDKMIMYLEDEAQDSNYAKYEAGRNKANQTTFIAGIILDGDGLDRLNRSNDPYQP